MAPNSAAVATHPVSLGDQLYARCFGFVHHHHHHHHCSTHTTTTTTAAATPTSAPSGYRHIAQHQPHHHQHHQHQHHRRTQHSSRQQTTSSNHPQTTTTATSLLLLTGQIGGGGDSGHRRTDGDTAANRCRLDDHHNNVDVDGDDGAADDGSHYKGVRHRRPPPSSPSSSCWQHLSAIDHAHLQHHPRNQELLLLAEDESSSAGSSSTSSSSRRPTLRCPRLSGDCATTTSATTTPTPQLLPDGGHGGGHGGGGGHDHVDCGPVAVTTLPTLPRQLACLLLGAVRNASAVAAMYANVMLVVGLLMVLMVPCTDAAKQEGCTFPARWEGSWFLSGNQQPVFIKGSTLSFRGKCIASEGDKFLVADEKGCHRCLVMYEKHRNVLQYKESECEGDNMYMDQSNPAAMPMREQPQRSILNSGGDHRGAAHPNQGAHGNNGNQQQQQQQQHQLQQQQHNGHARVSSSDPYSMRSHDDTTNDYYCKGRENLQTLCEQIAGDALLYSLFKEDAEPVKCPLRGPYSFTYNRGHGECTNPVSNIESCTEDSRLLLSFQACPDVSGTESTVEELTCLATWKDGNSRYLVGLVSHHHAISNEERYRCFVYEKLTPGNGGSSKDEYKLAQSGDATCNGLDSAEVGSRIMTLQMAPTTERCDFPTWFKGPKKWHALMGNTGYNFHQSDGSLHIIKANSGVMETRALCEQINKQTPTEMMSVVHYTTGCQSGFMCMMFYRRDVHVAEIQMGTPASRLEDACAPDHFDVAKLPFITLLASNPEAQICPVQGMYGLRGAVGPPSITSRHKRNHQSNHHGKEHSAHHHHAAGSHRRHSTLSFRNPDEFDHTSWRSHSRGLPKRNRRDTASPQLSAAAAAADHPSAAAPTAGTAAAAATAASSASPPPTTATASAGTAATAATASVASSSSSSSSSTADPIIGDADDQLTPDLSPPPTPPRRPSRPSRQQSEDRRNVTRSRRDTPGCIVNYAAHRQLLIGCLEPNVIEVRPQCNEEGDEVYHCHGSWVENDTTFIIAWHPASQHGVCISYMPLEGGNAARLIVGDACRRSHQSAADHHLQANLTVYGSCSDPSSSMRSAHRSHALLWCGLPLLVALMAATIRRS